MTDVAAIAWSSRQQAALDRVAEWLRDPWAPGASREPGVFRLFGYAGTGKSTLARSAAATAGGMVKYAAFTGKAAQVMNAKGCWGATTIHRLIYLPRIKCTQHLRELEEQARDETDEDRAREIRVLAEAERTNLARPAFTLNVQSQLRSAALLVLDEVSMVGLQHGQDLLSFEVPILALGDPGQLPPVRDRGYFTDPRQEPDVLLEEIHRQSEGSSVLDLASMARRGVRMEYGDYGESRVARRKDLPIAAAAEFDQIIVGRNETRRAINDRVRTHLGRGGPLPEQGDRLVCLRNDYEAGLLNGTQWEVLKCDALDSERMVVTIFDPTLEKPQGITVEAHRAYVEGREPKFYDIRDAQCLDWAYAVTCHKAQGSEWRSVCVVDESFCFKGEERRWLYTAVTRASERVTVVR